MALSIKNVQRTTALFSNRQRGSNQNTARAEAIAKEWQRKLESTSNPLGITQVETINKTPRR